MDWNALLYDTSHPSYAIIKRIVADLKRDHILWSEKVREFELVSAASSAGYPTEAAEEIQAQIQSLAVDIQSYVAELNFLGIEFDIQQLFSERR